MNFFSALKKTGKWSLRIFAAIVCLAVAVLFISRFASFLRESKTPQQAAPKNGHYVSAAGVNIFVQEAGPKAAQAVILVHGTGAWSELWRETINVLAKNQFHVVAIDLPPFGFSEKPNGPENYSRQKQAQRIIGVLDALNIQRAIFVGHSVGARPTIEAALVAPQRVQSLVLVDPALGFAKNADSFEQNNPSWMLRAFFAFRPLRNAGIAAVGTNPWFTKTLFNSFVSNKAAVTPERVKMLQQPLKVKNITPAEGDWLEYLLVSRDNSLSSDFNNFKKLKAPTLIIWGSSDAVTPLWQGEHLQKLIPNSTLSVINNVGHIPYIEAPAEFNEILASFLK